ncbi:MAG: DUF1043 family protein, partial [Pseudomonadota bacterium]
YSSIVVILVGIGSVIVGALLGFFLGKQRESLESAKAEEIKEQYEQYKTDVNNHFNDTAKHFAAIGQEYRALYNHMANGAESLLGPDSEVRRAGFPFLPASSDIAGSATDTTDSNPDAAREDMSEPLDATGIDDSPAANDPTNAVDDAEEAEAATTDETKSDKAPEVDADVSTDVEATEDNAADDMTTENSDDETAADDDAKQPESDQDGDSDERRRD